jgi:spermidine synthase
MTTDSSLWISNLVDGLAGLTIKAKHALYCNASPFQKIEVFDTYSYGNVLMLGGVIVLTERDEHIYNEMIAHPALLAHPRPAAVCVVGGGDGGALREVLRHDCVIEAVAVDIDAMVTETVKQFFPSLGPAFDDPRSSTAYADGCAWLEESDRTFDVIMVDSYDPGGPVQSLETGNFFELVRAHLRDEGIAVVQTGSPELRADDIRRTMRDLGNIFAWTAPYVCTIPSFPLGLCSFVLCGTTGEGVPSLDPERLAAVGGSCRYFSGEALDGAVRLPASVRAIFTP